MASKKKKPFRGSGSAVRKHAWQRLRQYVGNSTGYTDRIGRRILLACHRVAKRTGAAQVYLTPETLKEGGADPDWLEKFNIQRGLRAIFSPDRSVINVFQEE